MAWDSSLVNGKRPENPTLAGLVSSARGLHSDKQPKRETSAARHHALTERFSLALNVPFSIGQATRLYPDRKYHTSSVSGIGDIHLVGSAWLWDPLNGDRVNGGDLARYLVFMGYTHRFQADGRPSKNRKRRGMAAWTCPSRAQTLDHREWR